MSLPRKSELKRTAWFPKVGLDRPKKPRKALKKRSKSRQSSDKAYRELVPLEGVKCFDPDCQNAATERHHLWPQAKYPFLIKEPLNIIPGCEAHHNLWDSKKQQCRAMVRRLDSPRMRRLAKMIKETSKVGY